LTADEQVTAMFITDLALSDKRQVASIEQLSANTSTTLKSFADSIQPQIDKSLVSVQEQQDTLNVNQAELGNRLDKLTQELNNMNRTIGLLTQSDNFTNNIVQLQSQVNALTDRIQVIENAGAYSPKYLLSAKIIPKENLVLANGSNLFSGDVEVTIANNHNVSVYNIRFVITLQADKDIGTVTSVAITGWNLSWVFDKQIGNILYFTNKTGLNIESAKELTMSLHYEVYFASKAVGSIQFTPSISVVDWD
jgi:hypothetical protein